MLIRTTWRIVSLRNDFNDGASDAGPPSALAAQVPT